MVRLLEEAGFKSLNESPYEKVGKLAGLLRD